MDPSPLLSLDLIRSDIAVRSVPALGGLRPQGCHDFLGVPCGGANFDAVLASQQIDGLNST